MDDASGGRRHARRIAGQSCIGGRRSSATVPDDVSDAAGGAAASDASAPGAAGATGPLALGAPRGAT
ncbi:hypothetical protein K6W24_28415, partial [Burkholderia dolosa]|uniref:hypothetical protein n=1 Tax=Burkholderia dolosa TaxID=152500 RepID=UPI001C93463F